VLDDRALILRNDSIKETGRLLSIFASNLYQFSFKGESDYYRPLQAFTYALDYHFWKLNPFGYHLSSILLHGFNAFLVFVLLRRLFSGGFAASVTAAFFCVHPLQMSAVAYVSGRADLLAFCFMLLSLIFLLRALDQKEFWSYPASLAAYGFALLSRENALLLPFYAAGLCWGFGRKSPKAYKVLSGYLFITALYLFGRFYVAEEVNNPNLYQSYFPFYLDLLNFIHALSQILSLVVIPWPLHLVHASPFITRASAVPAHVFYVLLIFVLTGLLVKRSGDKLLSFGLWWAAVGFLPILRLVYYNPSLGAVMAENWFYFPSLGVFAAMAALCSCFGKMRRIFFAAMLLIFYAGVAWAASPMWRNERTFYEHILKHAPQVTYLRLNLSNVYFLERRYAEALSEIKLVKEKEPERWDVYFQFGNIYMALRDTARAEREFLKSLSLCPDRSFVLMKLGILYDTSGQFSKAEETYGRAIRVNPGAWLVRLCLGDLYLRTGRYAKAAECYEKAVELAPFESQPHLSLGALLGRQGREKAAALQFQKALRLDPDSFEARKNLGVAFANSGYLAQAVRLWESVRRMNPADEELRQMLEKAHDALAKI
jgi:Flp pilus assembly protein TadD